MNKKLTIIRLEKILREMISKVDTRATNFKVRKSDGIDSYMISVDVLENKAFTYEGKFYPESKKLDVDWVYFGKNKDGVFFYSVDGIEGRHYFGHQDYNQNLQIAYSFIQQKLAPYNLEFRNKYGVSLVNQNKLSFAIDEFQFIINEDNNFVSAYTNLGYVYLLLGKKDKALLYYNYALRINPNHEKTLINKAQLLLLDNKRKDAFLCVDKLLKLNPDNQEAMNILNNINDI